MENNNKNIKENIPNLPVICIKYYYIKKEINNESFQKMHNNFNFIEINNIINNIIIIYSMLFDINNDNNTVIIKDKFYEKEYTDLINFNIDKIKDICNLIDTSDFDYFIENIEMKSEINYENSISSNKKIT
jgi:hypothetical protein